MLVSVLRKVTTPCARVHRSELMLNTLVLLKQASLPNMKWRLGTVVAVHPGKDLIAWHNRSDS